MKKVVILGAGQAGMAALELLNSRHTEAVSFGDNNAELQSQGKIPVLPVVEALADKPDLVIVSVLGAERSARLAAQARELGYEGEIMLFNELNNCFDIRSATLKRIAERIRENGAEGCLAELGVYRGDFARQLNGLFPDRKLYLFDTFEGFCENDIEVERKMGLHIPIKCDFSDTRRENVLANMPFAEQIVLKKGRFPETSDGLEEIFALVSIDADLYAPTLAGLEYFYPRLSVGGAIVLHDYNSRRFEGVKRAAEAYEKWVGPLPLAPLCDVHGTAVIVK